MTRTRLRIIIAAAFGICAVTGSAVGVAPAFADTAPAESGVPVTAGTASLPTVQVDGVVWSQVIIGNTVYVGGQFTTAYPAGKTKAEGVPRKNLLAYDITTGNLIDSWNPGANGAVRALTASPDGTRLYVGGIFTEVAGQTRYRAAGFDVASGELTPWRPSLNAAVYAIAAVGDTVYLGGGFTTAGNYTRNRAAAYSVSTGALLPFDPNLGDGTVNAITTNADGSIAVLGGAFTSVGGQPRRGLAGVNGTSGAPLQWAVNDTVQNGGSKAAILGLVSDASGFYAVGYNFDRPKNTKAIEGTVKVGWDGSITWLADCHGDSYSAALANDVVYIASHAHDCANIPGGNVLPQTTPESYLRGSALQNVVAGTNGYQHDGYPSFEGIAAPRLLHFYPDLAVGSVTGANQAAWNVVTNGKYVLYGGEFPKVNDQPQAGLARFAFPSVQKSTDGPRLSGATMNPRLTASETSVQADFTANWDRDNRRLTYALYREGVSDPVATTQLDSAALVRPNGSLTDRTVQPGTDYRYRLATIDPDGNETMSEWINVRTPGQAPTNPPQPGGGQVPADAAAFWSLNDAAGSSAATDSKGGSSLRAGSGVGFGAAGRGDGGTAVNLDGSRGGKLVSPDWAAGPTEYTYDLWFKSSTTQGGVLMGYGDGSVGSDSSLYDRNLYMGNDGRLSAGIYNTSRGTVTTRTDRAYNDGNWHHARVSYSQSAGTLKLTVDDEVKQLTGVSAAHPYFGRWHVGGDRTDGWPNAGTSSNFAGTIDNVTRYNTAK